MAKRVTERMTVALTTQREAIIKLYNDYTMTLTEAVRTFKKQTGLRLETDEMTRLAVDFLDCARRPEWTKFRTGALPNGTKRKATFL